MDKREARALLSDELAPWRARSYADLVSLIGETEHYDRVGSSGVVYQVEIEVMWGDMVQHFVLVIGSIDDGGWRAFSPLTDSFVVAPTAESTGEQSQ